MLSYFYLPLLGVLVGLLGGSAGVGGAILLVPTLIFLGFNKSLAIGTSFLNVLAVTLAALFLFGLKGSIDWKAGGLLAIGSVVGVWLGVNFIQPQLNERTFRIFFAVLLISIAITIILKK